MTEGAGHRGAGGCRTYGSQRGPDSRDPRAGLFQRGQEPPGGRQGKERGACGGPAGRWLCLFLRAAGRQPQGSGNWAAPGIRQHLVCRKEPRAPPVPPVPRLSPTPRRTPGTRPQPPPCPSQPLPPSLPWRRLRPRRGWG